LGSQQLIAVGKELRRRYVGKLLPKTLGEAVDMLYCRSTNICRTMQSLRSLLVGLYDTHTECEHDNEAIMSIKKQGLLHHLVPTIETRPRTKETLFPQADGPSPAVTKLRLEIFPNDYLINHFPGYSELEKKVGQIFGFTEKAINWLTVKEVLTCYSVHNIELPNSITLKDVEKITDLVGFMWGRIYGDDELNRLAIGRFIREMISDLESSLSESQLSCHVKMLLYSGHDSTLVPLLCALGIYDGVWPLYASYITIETVICRNSDKKKVRVTYNDKDQIIKGADNIWCDYEVFMNRMKKMSISRVEYNMLSAGEALPDDI
jgi:lysophosphatidic acid phosphatase type 6